MSKEGEKTGETHQVKATEADNLQKKKTGNTTEVSGCLQNTMERNVLPSACCRHVIFIFCPSVRYHRYLNCHQLLHLVADTQKVSVFCCSPRCCIASVYQQHKLLLTTKQVYCQVSQNDMCELWQGPVQQQAYRILSTSFINTWNTLVVVWLELGNETTGQNVRLQYSSPQTNG